MKDEILKFIMIIAWMVLCISIMSFDSENVETPLICASVSLIWILLITIANSKNLDNKEHYYKGGWR